MIILKPGLMACINFFNDRLGFLMLPVDLLVRMADMYASAGTASAGIPFPEFKWVDGTVIIPGQIHYAIPKIGRA